MTRKKTERDPIKAAHDRFLKSGGEHDPFQAGTAEGETEGQTIVTPNGARKPKSPRTSYYLLVGRSKADGTRIIISRFETIGRANKMWEHVSQTAHMIARDIELLRVKPVGYDAMELERVRDS